MRKFLPTSFIALALVVSASSFAPVAHAQFCDSAQICTYSTQAAADAASASYAAAGELTPAQQAASAAATPAASSVYDPAAAKTKTDYGDTDSAYNGIMIKIMSLFAWLVGVAAVVLDYAVYYTVVTMGNYVNHLSAIGVTWRVLRDIGNIMLIFGFLAVGITTILNVEWYGGGKKMLPMMLVAAVFLNFSLFISEAIVDTGNLFATQFFTQINGGDLPTAGASGLLTNASGATLTTANEGISSKIMSQLGLQGIYGSAMDPAKAKFLFTGANQWFVGFMGIILFIVTAFVMFSLAFVLIARFVALVFLLVVAPVGFAGLAVPGFAKRASQWWTTLFEQTITAPILLLMLYIALAVITDAQFLTGSGVSTNTGSTASNDAASMWVGFVQNANLPGFASMMLSFLLAMGLLLAVIVYAKRWSAFGGDWASKMGAKLSFGATAWAGRTTVGWGANRAAKYLRSTRVGRIPLAGTGLVRGLEGVAGGSFDVRGTGALKSIPFGSNIEAGTAQKGGYKADLKARIESRTKYAGELKGRDFADLDTSDKFKLAGLERTLEDKKKELKNARNEDDYKRISDEIKAAETEIDSFHKEKGTDRGNKLKYASNLELGYLKKVGVSDEALKVLNMINLAANTDAAKKIKEDAKKSKDDKELDTLRKALKKAGGEEEGGGGGTAGGGGGGGAPTGGTGGGEAPAGH